MIVYDCICICVMYMYISLITLHAYIMHIFIYACGAMHQSSATLSSLPACAASTAVSEGSLRKTPRSRGPGRGQEVPTIFPVACEKWEEQSRGAFLSIFL